MGNKQGSLTSQYVIIFLFVVLASFIVFMFELVLVQCLITGMVAYLLNPLVIKLEGYKFSRRVSVILIIIFFFGLTGSFIVILIPIIYYELMLLIKFLIIKVPIIQDELAPSLLNSYKKFSYDNISDIVKILNNSPENLLTIDNIKLFINSLIFILKNFSSIMIKALNSSFNISSIIVFILVAPILLFYFLFEWPTIIKNIYNIIPLRYQKGVSQHIIKIDNVISAYIRGQFTVCMIMAVYYIIVLTVMGLNYSVLLGLMTGILTFIPYVGSILCTMINLLISIVQFGDYMKVLFILGLLLLGQVIEGNVIVPFLIGKQVDLHPMWIIIGMIVSASKMGFIGLILSIPITATVGILIKSLLIKYKHSKFYKGIT